MLSGGETRDRTGDTTIFNRNLAETGWDNGVNPSRVTTTVWAPSDTPVTTNLPSASVHTSPAWPVTETCAVGIGSRVDPSRTRPSIRPVGWAAAAPATKMKSSREKARVRKPMS